MEMIPAELFRTAFRLLLNTEPLQLAVFVFGVAVVIILSVLYLWKHVAKGG